MNTVSILAVLAMLVVVIYQDFRYRAVSWLVFPLLFMILFIHASANNGIRTTGVYAIYNSLFFLSQLLVVFLYVRFRTHQSTFFFNRYIGAGDVFFFLSISPFAQLPGYILYLISGLALTLVFHFLVRLFKMKESTKDTVPLAGFMAAYLAALLLVQLQWPHLWEQFNHPVIFSFTG